MNAQSFDRIWFDEIEVDPSYSVKLDFALALERAIERSGINRSDLARLIKSSPAWITKVLSGEANLTIETMTVLAKAIEHEVHIHLAPKVAAVRWFEAYEKASSLQNKSLSKSVNEWSKFKEQPYEQPIPAAA